MDLARVCYNQDFNQIFFSAHSYMVWSDIVTVILFLILDRFITHLIISCEHFVYINCDDVLIFIPFYDYYLHKNHIVSTKKKNVIYIYHSLVGFYTNFLFDFFYFNTIPLSHLRDTLFAFLLRLMLLTHFTHTFILL